MRTHVRFAIFSDNPINPPCTPVLRSITSPNEEHLLCSLENNQIFSLLLSNQEIMKADEMNFDVMGTPNHQVRVRDAWLMIPWGLE